MPAAPDFDPNLTSGSDAPGGPVAAPPVAERYALGDEIARGGMGAVYRATDTSLGREVAVKVLQERFAPDSGTARRFADEARIAAQLQHPGIPPIHDYGTLPDGRPFLAMKLIKGDTLDDLLKQRPDPSADRGRFVAAFEAVCQAVAYAHSNGVIHRDLKPANVMVGKFGEVQVMDWGLAKVLLARSASEAADPDATTGGTEVRSLRDSDDQYTQAGSVLGTPAYMPPEQAVGAVGKVDARSDVFGLGAVLAVILTGKPPFTGSSAETTRVKAATGDVADCLARLDGCGAEPELVALCKRCLSPKPDDRPAHAGEVAAAVAAFRHDAEARARQAELDRVKADGERKRRRVLVAAAFVLVAAAGGVAVWRVSEDGKKQADARQAEGEEALRRHAEQERNARAADSVAALLEQVKEALEAGDAARAAPPLAHAEKRATDDAVVAHANRLAAYTTALGHLRTIDGADTFSWTAVGSRLPAADRVAERWAAAFRDVGIVPGSTPPAEVAARMSQSPVRVVFLRALHEWLVLDPSEPLRAILDAADDDAFRFEARRIIAAQGREGVAALSRRREWEDQPAWSVTAYTASSAVPPADQRRLLERAALRRPADFGLMMRCGATFPVETPDSAGQRARWFQAALALRPASPVAMYRLAFALEDLGVPTAAEAGYREAIRLDPKLSHSHNGLGNVLMSSGDLVGAEAAYREAIRVEPTNSHPHNGLGNVLRRNGDLVGAEKAYREASRLDPKNGHPHNGLGLVFELKGDLVRAEAAFREAVRAEPWLPHGHYGLGSTLRMKGDFAGAEAAFREAVRVGPRQPLPYDGLGLTYEDRFEFDRAEAAYREAVRLAPRYANAHAKLGRVVRKQGRHAEAADVHRASLAILPGFTDARVELSYCLRVLGGEVPTAPPPRPVFRP